jgi:ABC-type phosphate/phosphonate transport system substrate-binding protein
LLAAPVPSPLRYGDRPVYVTDFVVAAGSPFTRLEDTFGGRLAFSVTHSHSGYNAARYFLLAFRSPTRPALYAEVRGPYVRQLAAIEAVIAGEADVAPIDGYAHDLLRRHDPCLAEQLRVVATTGPAPSPPLVASVRMDRSDRERLSTALLEAHEASELTGTMSELLLRRFVRVGESDFETFLEWQRAAEAAGYPALR